MGSFDVVDLASYCQPPVVTRRTSFVNKLALLGRSIGPSEERANNAGRLGSHSLLPHQANLDVHPSRACHHRGFLLASCETLYWTWSFSLAGITDVQSIFGGLGDVEEGVTSECELCRWCVK